MTTAETLFVGIGSPHGDDQAGWRVADALRAMHLPAPIAIHKAQSPADLLNWLAGQRRLILCDACRGQGAVGTIRQWRWPDTRLAHIEFSGTHDLSLVSVLTLAASLKKLPEETFIWTIEAESLKPLSDLSDEVAIALAGLIDRVRIQFESKDRNFI